MISAKPDDRIQERFERFDSKHPDIYTLFVEYAWRLKRNGRRHYSADAILHVIRFYHATSAQGTKPYKICNDYSSRYARKLVAEQPEHFGEFFKLRELSCDRFRLEGGDA